MYAFIAAAFVPVIVLGPYVVHEAESGKGHLQTGLAHVEFGPRIFPEDSIRTTDSLRIADSLRVADSLQIAALNTAELDSAMVSDESAAEEVTGEVATEIATGQASYYGHELAGRRTASGERFDPQLLTAAHRTLPFGSRVRVTNLNNGKSVVVRINDRGPFTRKRVIDISRAAAREIGMVRSGIAKVRLELLRNE